MNSEVIKAMQGKKEHKARKWWRKNGYKIMRVILFPLWVVSVLKNKCRVWLNNRQEWSEERAAEILNYYIPRASEWDEEDQSFYFFDNGRGWNLRLAKQYLKRKDRRFWKVYCGWWGGEMRTFLLEKFELEGFTKEIGNCWEGWTEISFVRNEKTP
jgi:hypothetical protein